MLKKSFVFSLGLLTCQLANAHATVSYLCDSCDQLETKPVHYSWVIGQAPIKPSPALVRLSQRYQLNVDNKQLLSGIKLPHLNTAAIIKITPTTQSKAASLIPQQLRIIAPDHRSYPVTEASEYYADAQSLSQSPYYGGEILTFQLKESLGSGQFTLQSDNPGSQQYTLSLYDKNSPIKLALQTDKIHYLYGDKLSVRLRLEDNTQNYPIDTIKADLISPKGEKVPLNFSQNKDGTYIALMQLNDPEATNGLPYYIDVSTNTKIDNSKVKREAKTAFSYAIPSATVTKFHISPTLLDEDLVLTTDIEVATESRYEIEGTLYATADDGKLYPFMQAQSAQWFDKGAHSLNLYFAAKALSISTMHKPYELRNIRIIDQGQLAPVTEGIKTVKVE